jgi:hypothetical protein
LAVNNFSKEYSQIKVTHPKTNTNNNAQTSNLFCFKCNNQGHIEKYCLSHKNYTPQSLQKETWANQIKVAFKVDPSEENIA